MAGKKISELQALTEITGQEMIPVARDGQNYSVLSSLLQSGDATKLNDYAYDVSLLMGKMAVRGNKINVSTTNPSGAGYYHMDGSYTKLGTFPYGSTVVVKAGKIYHFDIGYFGYSGKLTDPAVLVLFDENDKVLTAIPWAEGGFRDKYLIFTSAVKKYGVTYNITPVAQPYLSIYAEAYEIQDLTTVINTSQGNRALYVAAGAVYNEQTGFYELNGLTDITEEQMRNIYVKTIPSISLNDKTACFTNLNIRTNIPFIEQSGYKSEDMQAAFSGCTTLNVAFLARSNINFYGSRYSYAFRSCTSLKTIFGNITFPSGQVGVVDMFKACNSLVTVNIRNLNISISFSDSPLISLESLQYLITNAANTSPITVTVHADVYAKIQDETQTEWHALIASAQEKQITFATV